MTDADHDAVLKVKDIDRTDTVRGPSGKDIVWSRVDGQPIISSDESDELDRLYEKAHDHLDIDNLEHGEVVARIWISNNRTVDGVKWSIDPATDRSNSGDENGE